MAVILVISWLSVNVLFFHLLEMLNQVLRVFQQPIPERMSNFLFDDDQLSDVGESHHVQLHPHTHKPKYLNKLTSRHGSPAVELFNWAEHWKR